MTENMDSKALRRSNLLLALAAVLMLAGLGLLAPIWTQSIEASMDEQEYGVLRKEARAADASEQTIGGHWETMYAEMDAALAAMGVENAESPEPLVTQTPEKSAGSIDHAALKAKNRDYAAWLTIPGTKIDYPVVQSDDTAYYLSHTFAGKKSKLGTLLSLPSADYAAPGKNIAIYGHHLSQGNQMFSQLMNYKNQSYYASHDTICLDAPNHAGTYQVFAVVNLHVGEWEPATSGFASDEAFMAFVRQAQEQSLYATDVEVAETDHILTLITCDRSYGGADGRLAVMAVER